MSDPKCASPQIRGGQHTPGLWTRQVKWVHAKSHCLCCIWGVPSAGKTFLTVPSPEPRQTFSWPSVLPAAALHPQHCCDLGTGCWGCFWAKPCQHDLLSALVPLDPPVPQHIWPEVLLTSLNKEGNGCQKCLLMVAHILKCHKP